MISTEYYILAHMVKFPVLSKLLDKELLISKTAKDLYDAIVEIDNDIDTKGHAIPRAAWDLYIERRKSKQGIPYFSKIDIDHIYIRMEDAVKDKNEIEALYNMRFSINALRDENYIASAKDTLVKAEQLLNNHRLRDAVSLVRSMPFPTTNLYLKSTIDAMKDAVESSNSFKSGIAAVDKLTGGLSFGNIMSIGGATGSMKTKISVWMIFQMLKANPSLTALYFEKEMPRKDVDRRLITTFTGIDEKEIFGASNFEEKNAIISVIEQLRDNPATADLLARFTVVPTTEFKNAQDMYHIIEEYRPNIWCLDYMTQLQDDKGKDKNGFVMEQIAILKEIVQVTDSFGIILNQIKKGTADTRQDKRPIMDDIEWSGDIKNVSAYVLATFFPVNYYEDDFVPDERYFYLIALKNRHNKPFHLPLLAEPSNGNFYEPSGEEKLRMISWYNDYNLLMNGSTKRKQL